MTRLRKFLKTWKPGRPVNTITEFEDLINKGHEHFYVHNALLDLDLLLRMPYYELKCHAVKGSLLVAEEARILSRIWPR